MREDENQPILPHGARNLVVGYDLLGGNAYGVLGLIWVGVFYLGRSR